MRIKCVDIMRHSIYSDGRINIIKSYFLYFHSVRFFFSYRIILTDYPLLPHPVTVSLYLCKGDCSTALRLAAFPFIPSTYLVPSKIHIKHFEKLFPLCLWQLFNIAVILCKSGTAEIVHCIIQDLISCYFQYADYIQECCKAWNTFSTFDQPYVSRTFVYQLCKLLLGKMLCHPCLFQPSAYAAQIYVCHYPHLLSF